MKMTQLLIAAITMAAVAVPLSIGQEPAKPETNVEATVVCSEDVQSSPEITPYGFARATLTSLWYARNTSDLDREIEKGEKEADNYSSFLATMMRVTKTSTENFTCAKRALMPFVTQGNSTSLSPDQQRNMGSSRAHTNA